MNSSFPDRWSFSYLKFTNMSLIGEPKYKWAPSSEFVSSSIPSWQISTAHAQPFRGARDLAFCLKVPLDSLLVWASSGGSGETARMCRLAWTFAARICDKYQIRLTRSKYGQQEQVKVRNPQQKYRLGTVNIKILGGGLKPVLRDPNLALSFWHGSNCSKSSVFRYKKGIVTPLGPNTCKATLPTPILVWVRVPFKLIIS